MELLKLMELHPYSYDVSNLVLSASKNPNPEILKWVISRADFDYSKCLRNPLLSCLVLSYDCVCILVDRGFLKNNKIKILRDALRYQSLETVKYLILNGCDIDKVVSPLHAAAVNSDNPSVVRYLLENFDLDVNEKMGRETPLVHHLSESQTVSFSICRALLEFGSVVGADVYEEIQDLPRRYGEDYVARLRRLCEETVELRRRKRGRDSNDAESVLHRHSKRRRQL